MVKYQDIDQIVSTTHHTVNVLSQEKNGGDALLLYFRYIQQRKMQENSTTMSHDNFMMKAMGRGKERFYKVKKILVGLGLIEVLKKVTEEQKIDGRYIKVNFIISDKTRVRENQSLALPESGKQETNTLIVNTNTPIVNTNTLLYEKKLKGEKALKPIPSSLPPHNSATPPPVRKPKAKKSQRPGTIPYGEFKRVFITEDEYNRLVVDYGKGKTDGMIQSLDGSIGSKGDKYLDHNLTIRHRFNNNGIKKLLPPSQELDGGLSQDNRG